MMRPLRDVPIRQKLMVIIMLTTAAALLLSGVGIVALDSYLFRASMQRDLSALARIVADSSTAALAFDDAQAAAQTLAALRARPHMVAGCIYRENGTMLAGYERTGESSQCPAPLPLDDVRFTELGLTVSHPILLQNRRIGTLVLLYDLGEIPERITLYGEIVLAILLASSVIALLISSRLRALIATPISRLAQAATSVSETRDYSIRAPKLSGDELGVLVDEFNEMLERIQLRDEELKQALASLKSTNENLARSNEDLERFAFVASHDLQEPLRMITTYAQLLVKTYRGELDPDASMFVDNIVQGTKRMRELLIDLLAYTEIRSRTDEPVEAVDLNCVLEKVRENLKAAIDASGATIISERLPTLPGYEGHFIPLLQNLIGNAIKYRSDQPPVIAISVERAGGEYQFAVVDNGIGIDPEYHERIFEVFRRLHGKKIPGTGIGLSICQRVVERYGGRIWVESREGRGSKFVFTLPRAGAASAASGEGR
jgi:signal transduction histidine kinase